MSYHTQANKASKRKGLFLAGGRVTKDEAAAKAKKRGRQRFEERGDGIRRSGRADGKMMRKDSKSAWVPEKRAGTRHGKGL